MLRPPAAARLRTPLDAASGFTLIELMVVVAIMGLAMSVVFTGSVSLLPQARLRSSATQLAASLEQARSTAVLRQEPLVFEYDLERGGYKAYHDYVRNEKGENVGFGQTPVVDWVPMQSGIAIREVRLPGTSSRDGGVVALTISALGRIPPHEVVIFNPDYPDIEILTVRVSGIANRSTILKGDDLMEPLNDVDFR